MMMMIGRKRMKSSLTTTTTATKTVVGLRLLLSLLLFLSHAPHKVVVSAAAAVIGRGGLGTRLDYGHDGITGQNIGALSRMDPLLTEFTGKKSGWVLESIPSKNMHRLLPRSVKKYLTGFGGEKKDDNKVHIDLSRKIDGLATGEKGGRYRASATTMRDAKTLRASWRQPPLMEMLTEEKRIGVLMGGTFEDAVGKKAIKSTTSGQFQIEIEVYMPAPSRDVVRYIFPTSLGVLNPGAARTSAPGRMFIGDRQIGTANFHLPMKTGLADPAWARGKNIFWKGRPLGTM